MLNIPGYTLRGAIKSTSANLLFHAVRDSDGLPLILKTPMASSPSPREFERYRREFAILQRLRDVRGVTRVHACEQRHDRPVLLLESVEGVPLSALTGEPLEVARVLELGISLASTLAVLHRHGVIHKDIKPSNVIVTPSGGTCLIDFGSATLQRVEHVEAVPAPLIEGTLAYMSPEQTGRMNRSVDYRTDLYSLGVTLYELLVGSRPFHGRDALEWFHAHMAQAPRPPLAHVPTLPPVLSAIVLKLLAKMAEERYQSAEGLKADLERCRDALRRGILEDFPLGVHDFPTRFQLPQRLYGRDAQAADLLQGFERVARGDRPELFLIRGYSGIGKSSVVHELHKPVVRQRGFFLSGKFDQLQQASPYATLAQALHGLTQQLLASSDEELARWRAHLLEAWDGEGQILVNVVPQLELVAGKQPAVPELPPSEAQQRVHRVFRKSLGVFATPEHPLVIFLDDLQWADLASLRLIQHLLTHPDTPPVLWIGAYRDNEVSPTHPLAQTLESLRKAGARMTAFQLEPLGLEEVQQLVADTLPGAQAQVVQELSALVREKTGGNPFFLLQFMQTLHQDGLLVRTPEGSWRWDAEGIRAKGYSDNIVDFLVGKLRQLPPGTQHLLRLAACVGNSFQLALLRILSGKGETAEVEQGLEPALLEGLLTRTGPEQYRFLHDRIQQAAYALIPVEERKAVHLRIGRLLLASLSPEQLHEKLFDVLSQLHAGAELIDDPSERHRVARLNAEAGAKAKLSSAFSVATGYFSAAFQLLPGDPWETDPALAFKVQLDRAGCEFMSGNAAEARNLAEELRPRARTRTELAGACRLKANLHLASGEMEAALTCLLGCLAQMGMPISRRPSWEEVVAANDEVWTLLGERSIESLIDQPFVEDPDKEALMSVCTALFGSALYTDQWLLVLQVCRMVSLILRHGATPAAVNTYVWYGVVLSDVFNRHREAQAFGQLACAFVERYGLSAIRGRILYLAHLVNQWTQPLPRTQEPILRAFQLTLQADDFQIACYCACQLVTNRLAMGDDLEEIYQESLARLAFVRQVGFRDLELTLHHVQGYVQQLRGLSRSFGSLSGDEEDEASFEASLTPNRMSTMRCWYYILKMQARYLSGAYAEAREAGARAAELTWSTMARLQLLDFHLYRALSLAACYAELTPEEKRQSLEAIHQHQQQLATWASHVPSTFRAPERMVSAELARISGRKDEAVQFYEQAFQAAREQGFLQNVALASELSARFWREQHVSSIAEFYARTAREAWLRWGAKGKVQHLEAQWPHLGAATSVGEASITDTDSTQIDALTVVKAQQAISGEIVLERLTATLLRVALENAGAQRAALLLRRGGELSVVALSGTSAEGGDVGPEEAPLPWTLISYVKRTREPVLIGDASQPHLFSADPWFSSSQARSILCLPLLRQEQLQGVLYLENSLTTNAFTPASHSLLEHLASQAAISIENARLYAEVQRGERALRQANDELERRVEERTRELKQAQAQLVNTARAAGMAEVAANVLHNVGNVLTSAVINLETMSTTLGASRVGRLKQVAGLLEEHQQDLAGFLTRDPRGARLSGYVSALADELQRNQASMQSDMQALGNHLEHIRDVVRVQQTYARDTLVSEECELQQLITDALSIQLPTLLRHGVTLTRELAALPKVVVDKHKVLQILINLISNAKNAVSGQAEGQRHLHVRLEAAGDKARIQVVDNGMGIAPELRPQLFSQGFTTRPGGHGLGLHSSALAARLLGGRLTLESEGPGKGATATLELPLA